MKTMKTKTRSLVPTLATWSAFLGIASIYLIGVSAMRVVDFCSRESFLSVCGQVVSAGTSAVDFSYHGWILAGALTAVLLHAAGTARMRVWIAACCVIAPWFWADIGLKGTAGWLLLMPATPLWTLQTVAGGADGEFYAEGFVVAVAVGWWMILWTLLGAAALARLKREKQNAVPDGPERRDAMGKRDFRRAPGVSP